MRKLIIFIMTLLLTVGAVSSSFVALASANSNAATQKETPIAKIPNDDYVPYGYSGATEPVAENLSLAVGFEPVLKTVTVMTTATGDTSRGNYVASQPIKNALVRLDGVPRYTDYKGQITAPLYREYVELFVERNGYNPYIEIIEATKSEKVVYLKQPSDDIEIFSVMLEYGDNFFNVLAQQSHVLKGHIDDYSELIVSANVEADTYMFYVNGELEKISIDGIIDMIDFEEYSVDDVFEIQVYYSGVYSKILPLHIVIDIFNPKDLRNQVEREFQESEADKNGDSLGIGNDESGIGNAGELSVPIKTVLAVLSDLIIPKSVSLDVGPATVAIEFDVDPFKGTLSFSVGISFEVDLKDVANSIADKLAHKKEKKDEYKARRDAESAAAEEQLKNVQKEIQQYNKDIAEKKGNLEEKKAQLLEAQNRYEKAKEEYIPHSPGAKPYRKEYKDAKHDYEKEKGKYANRYKDLCNTVRKNKLDKAETKSLLDFLKGKNNLKKKVGILKDFFKGGAKNATGQGGVSFDLEFELIGFVEYSYREGVIIDAGLRGEITFKPSYTYQGFAPVGPVVIPFYVTIGLNIGAEFTFISHSDEEPFKPMSFSDWFYNIGVAFNVGVRVDGGVGLAGIASVGVYGKANFEFVVNPVDERAGIFTWGAGVKVQFLIFEAEWGYESDDIYFYGGPEDTSVQKTSSSRELMARSLMRTNRLSDAQLFDGVYQISQPKLLPIDGGKHILLWIADDASRDDYNRGVLKYSIYDGSVWSDAKSVFGDSFSDYGFDAIVDNGEIVVSAQRIADIITAASDVESILSKSEIFAARLNLGAVDFSDKKRVTTNEILDANPQFLVSNNSAELTWRSNSANDYFGVAGCNEILYCGDIFGDSGKTSLFLTDEIIGNYSVARDDDGICTAVQVDSDGDLLTEGSDLILVKNGELMSSVANASSPSIIMSGNDLSLIYYSAGAILESKDLGLSFCKIVAEGASPIFTVTSQAGNAAVLYSKQDNVAEQVFAAVLDDAYWTDGVKISNETSENNDIVQLTGYYDGTDIYSAYGLADENGNVVICYTEESRQYDFELTATIYEKTEDDEQNTMVLSLINLGDFNVSRLRVSLNGFYVVIELDEKIAIGHNRSVLVDLPNGYNIFGKNTVLVELLNNTDAVVASKSTEVFVSEEDLAVSFEQIIVNGKQNFYVNIHKNSGLDCDGVVYAYMDGELYKEVDFFVTANGQIQLTITFDTLHEGNHIYFRVVPNVADRTVTDNSVAFYSWQDEMEYAVIDDNPYTVYLNAAKRFL